ncbi:hypothetical protein EUC41_27875 [Achromobacter denitrificans]|nr:hypothetical protein [Achromobacter sp.]WFC69789.1 hypothetical protein EUC41_27875 [Achromobacter denitrificans]
MQSSISLSVPAIPSSLSVRIRADLCSKRRARALSARRRPASRTGPTSPAHCWLREPGSVKPGSAMPDLGLSGQDARDIAAFLRTLPPAD